jgi:hypothetical protein
MSVRSQIKDGSGSTYLEVKASREHNVVNINVAAPVDDDTRLGKAAERAPDGRHILLVESLEVAVLKDETLSAKS